jgi:hypothetical protein
VDEGLAHLDAALTLIRQNGDAEGELRCLNNRSFVLQGAGRHTAAARDALDGLHLARERHLDRGASTLLLANLVECLDWLGRWDEALDHIREGLRQPIAHETAAALHGTEAHIVAYRGDLDAGGALARAEALAAGSLAASLAAMLAGRWVVSKPSPAMVTSVCAMLISRRPRFATATYLRTRR